MLHWILSRSRTTTTTRQTLKTSPYWFAPAGSVCSNWKYLTFQLFLQLHHSNIQDVKAALTACISAAILILYSSFIGSIQRTWRFCIFNQLSTEREEAVFIVCCCFVFLYLPIWTSIQNRSCVKMHSCVKVATARTLLRLSFLTDKIFMVVLKTFLPYQLGLNKESRKEA